MNSMFMFYSKIDICRSYSPISRTLTQAIGIKLRRQLISRTSKILKKEERKKQQRVNIASK